jgi:hypothetical protein
MLVLEELRDWLADRTSPSEDGTMYHSLGARQRGRAVR